MENTFNMQCNNCKTKSIAVKPGTTIDNAKVFIIGKSNNIDDNIEIYLRCAVCNNEVFICNFVFDKIE